MNNKGYSLLILLVVFLLIGLAYLYSFGNKEKESEISQDLKNSGLIEKDNNKNIYSQALEAAKKVKLSQMKSIGEEDYYIGNLNAPVKIIYYSDFECPFCPEYVETIKRVFEEYPEDVVIAFRHFILSNHNMAFDAAMAFECAAEQGEFAEIFYAFYQNTEKGLLAKEDLLQKSAELGLNKEDMSVCLEEERYKQKVQKAVEEARSYGVSGTPSTYINGDSLAGAYPYEDFTDQLGREKKGFKTIIEEELDR